MTTEPSSSGPSSGASSGSSSGGTGFVDETDASAVSSCHPSDLLTSLLGSYQGAAAPSGACLGSEGGQPWEDFYAACLGPAKTNEACQDFKALPSNAACAACIVTSYDASELGPILDYGQYVSGNVAGCIELTTPGDPTWSCPKDIQALTDCEIQSCEANCPVSDATSLAARDACALAADQAGCASLFAMASSCRAADVDAGLAAPCMISAFKDFYDAVVPLFCAAVPDDAGVAADAALADGAPAIDGGMGPDVALDAGAD